MCDGCNAELIVPAEPWLDRVYLHVEQDLLEVGIVSHPDDLTMIGMDQFVGEDFNEAVVFGLSQGATVAATLIKIALEFDAVSEEQRATILVMLGKDGGK